ncbi:MAG TPA: hypothetical protein VKR31_04865 [Rhizomicrobium sp.]|nr:hypothetical protein [Rhizomicrobium sp.]
MSDWRKAVQFRNRAELLRTIADEVEQEGHREALQRIAEHFDAMAASEEQKVQGRN